LIEVLESNIQDYSTLIDNYKQIKQEEAQFWFSLADYIILKTAQTAEESDRKTIWKQADEIRNIFTGEKTTNNELVDNAIQLDPMFITEFMTLKQSNPKITYSEFVKSKNLI